MSYIAGPSGYHFYEYIPSKPGAIVVAVLFAIGASALSWRCISTRTWFAIPFIVGAILEVVGYIARAIAEDTASSPLVPYIIQSILLLVAPALFAATIYMTLGRIIVSVDGDRHSIIKPARLTKTFVVADVLSFLAQSAGGGLQAKEGFNPDIAKIIILVGLFVQIVAFGLFAATAGLWHVRMRRWPSSTSSASSRWQHILFMLYGVSALIMVRSIFRVIEYAMGTTSYLMINEWPLYVFDAVLMLLTVGTFAYWYPGRLEPVLTKEGSDSASGSESRLEAGHM